VQRHPIKQVRVTRPAAGAFMVSLSLLGLANFAGCDQKVRRPNKINANEPVNTGLGNVAGDPGLALPRDEELMDRDDDDVRDQIAESARQLEVYFANLEIDGVDPSDASIAQYEPQENGSSSSQVATQIPDERENQVPVQAPVQTPVQSPIESSIETQTRPQAQNNQDLKGDGVRVSLLGGSSEDDGSDSATAEIQVESPVSNTIEETIDQSAPQNPDTVDPSEMVVNEKPIKIDPQVRKDQLAQELASILHELASTSDDPGSVALALATMETILPDGNVEGLDEGVLSESERASLEAMRSFLQSMSSEGSIASPAQVAQELKRIQNELNNWAGLTIQRAALCTRVDGYGRYDTFPSYRFVAGYAQPAIVYVELDRFAQREVTGPDGQPRYETELSQKLELYHVADDLNTWNTPVETVTDVTRNRLRDFYLINQITLPSNLGVGRYHIKVIMRDRIGERVAETIIPIEIVSR
jgi:hypothetical protein